MEPTRIKSISDDYLPILIRRLRQNSSQTPSGCIEWNRGRDRKGYGRIQFTDSINGQRRETGAHRAAWIAFRGPIEGDLVVDHLCNNPPCVNVEHLRLVSNSQNVLRGDHSAKAGRSGRRGSTAEPYSCGKHGRLDGRLAVNKDGYNYWQCRICNRERLAKFYAKHRN